jgi:serine-type D-Ala-D-Ala carboxypeptidase/endopeptidase (penicillin-binding protein 4)
MKKWIVYFLGITFLPMLAQAQVAKLLQSKVQALQQDKNFAQGILGFTVMDANTGAIVYSHNGNVGLPMASTQKTIIAIAALDKLKSNYTYETTFETCLIADTLMLRIKPSGDPSLASYMMPAASREALLNNILQKIPANATINCVKYAILDVAIDNTLCKAWTWEDMGNGYGAAAQAFNWRENLVDIFMNGSNNINGSTTVAYTSPSKVGVFNNEVLTGSLESGDGTNVYRAPDARNGVITGTIPMQSKNFEIHASLNGKYIFESELRDLLLEKKYAKGKTIFIENNSLEIPELQSTYTYKSAPLDSLLKRFLRKSINVYGEAFLKTIAKQQFGFGNYENGIKAINAFSKKINVDTHAVHIFDGSGLSPQNRITTQAMCKYLLYAKKAAWYSSFFDALPIINGVNMKSGSIHQTRAYTGYCTNKTGKHYVFAIVGHNYDGSGKEMQQKLWKILDVLK